MTTVAEAIQKVQKAETIIEGVTVWVSSIPQMIRDALAAANKANDDTPLLDLIDGLDMSAANLQTAMMTNSKGDVAPVGNIPGPSASAAPGSDAASFTTPTPSPTDPNAPQSGVQASDPSNPTIAQSQAGSQTADAAAADSGAMVPQEDASNAAQDTSEQ